MFNFLDKVQEPYVLETDMASDEFLGEMIKIYGENIKNSFFVLDGNNMKTWKDLFVEFQKVMQFPEYFGHNYGAFGECMQDLNEWHEYINEYIIFIQNSSNILISEENKDEEKSILINNMFEFLGEEWSQEIQYEDEDNVNNRKAYPFHVILSNVVVS